MDIHNVLVTGCGGDIGIAIGRILRDISIADRIYGCDIASEHAGRVFFDECFTMVRADDEDYFSRLIDIIEKNKIDLVIPAAEAELRLLMENNFFSRQDLFLTANLNSMKIGFDKLTTAEMLKDIKEPYPWTVDATVSNPIQYPCIWKSRTGCGSKQISFLQSEIDNIVESNGIYQEYISDKEGEFTCGLFRSAQGDKRCIVFRRKLRGGLTGSGEVVKNNDIEKLLMKIADKLNLRGSINVQLRLRNSIPYVFEINPRFSSTIMFRHKLGFKDLLWSIQDKMGLAIDGYEEVDDGVRFYKIYEDVIDWKSR